MHLNSMAPINFKWPVGLMDKASASGAGDSRFESWVGHYAKTANRLVAGD